MGFKHFPIHHLIFILIITAIISGFVYIGAALTGLLISIWGYLTLQQVFKTRTWIQQPLNSLMMTYIAWLAIITALSTVPDASLFTSCILAGLPIIYLTWANTPNPDMLWSRLRITLWLGSIILATWAIWQVINHVGYGWAAGPLIDRNAFAALMNLLWFPASYLFLTSKPASNRWIPLLLGAGLFIISTALFATASRGGIATWLLLLPILLWAGYYHTHSKLLVAIIPVIAILAYLCSTLLLQSNVVERATQLTQDSSTHARLLMWQSTIHMILAHPFSGTGWGTFAAYYPAYRSPLENTTAGYFAHNDYLQLAAEGGILALFLQLSIMLRLIIQLKRSLKRVSDITGLESVALLLGTLALFIHASVNFIFYFAFMNILAGLFLARAEQLVEPVKQRTLPQLNQISRPIKNILAGFIFLLLTAPLAIHLIAQLCLTKSRPGLKALKIIAPNIDAFDVAKLIAAARPQEVIAQEIMLEASEHALVDGADIKMPGVNFQQNLLKEALERFDFVRANTANSPNIGVREVKLLITYHANLDGNTAYTKAHYVLNTNLKTNPYHAYSMIELARLQVAEGQRNEALRTLQWATHHVLSRRDQQLIGVEILRQLAAPRIIPELDVIENQLRQVRSDSETGKPLILAPHFSEDIDARLNAIAAQIQQSH
ncbi:MAG: O-antigen ligase family protein [Sulfuriferula sp.]|nr:O-antigen ligase family protein [Sulfuriferula sp.]